MAALVCDICGGKLSMGAGGIAVCDSCGMEHTKERMKEKVQEIKGTVRVDNSHMIDNYFTMAENAYEADNKAEAEMYCNKIIEIDPTYCNAWVVKAKSAGWQSTIANSRLNEAATCFAKAIDLASEETLENIKTQATDEMKSLALALISLRGNRFAQYPDEEEANGFLNDIGEILSSVITLANKSGAVTTGFMEEIANKINQSVVAAWSSKIEPDYTGTDNRPNEYDWRQFIDRLGYCTMLVEKAIELSDNDEEEDIQRYENLIFLHQQAIKSCSWKEEYNSFWQNWEWKKEYSLTNGAKSLRRQMISDYENKISVIKNKAESIAKKEREEKERIEKEAAEKRYIEYWNAHITEKQSMESERDLLLKQIKQLKEEINQIPGKEKKQLLQEKISKLNSQKSSLGLFKSKEKKTLQEQIDASSTDLKLVENEMNNAKSEIENQIKPLQTKLSEIENELTKAR